MNYFRPLKPFTRPELLEIKAEFIRQSNATIKGKQTSLFWYDSLIHPWQKKLITDQPVVIIDFGGSYLRLGVMVSEDGQTTKWLDPIKIEKNVTEYPNTQIFIDWLADKTEPLLKKHSAHRLGFIFSHPFQPVNFHGHITGKVTMLNKSLYIPGIVGKDIGRQILRTLEGRDYSIDKFSMLNDSIALVLCDKAFVGLIVATGGNICSTHPQAPNLRNIEAGEFDGVPQTPASSIVNLADNPGHYLMEKQSTGKYQLENLIYACLLDNISDEICQAIARQRFKTGSLIVSQTSQGNFKLFEGIKLSPAQKNTIKQISQIILQRSYQMWGATTAAAIELNHDQIKGDVVKVPVTGGVILNDADYYEGLKKTIESLIDKKVELVKVTDPIKGAAVAALME
jgi:hexokinase